MTISGISSPDELQVFNFNGMQLRGLLIDGEPWFIALDLASILEYRMPSDMTRIVGEEDKGTHPVRTLGGVQNLAVISEPAFYQIVVQRQSGRLQKKSSREMIQQFQRWVTHVVLPNIRKTGGYNATTVKELTGAELMAKALLEAQSVLAQKDERIAQLEPKAKIADEVMTPDERLWGFREMVRVIIGNYNVTEDQIKEILRTKKIIEANSVKPRNDAVRTGYAKPVPFKNKMNGYEGTQTKFTQKTFEYVYSQLQPTLEIEAA